MKVSSNKATLTWLFVYFINAIYLVKQTEANISMSDGLLFDKLLVIFCASISYYVVGDLLIKSVTKSMEWNSYAVASYFRN